MVVHDQLLNRDAIHGDQVGVGRVHHHRCVDGIECALASHVDLAGATFLRRCSHDANPSARGFSDECCSQAGAKSGGADDVVTARVANARQRVVLAQHGDGGAGGADAGVESGLEVVGVAGGCHAVALEEPGQQIVREVLLKVQLRVCVNLVTGIDELVSQFIDACTHCLLERFRVVGGDLGHDA